MLLVLVYRLISTAEFDARSVTVLELRVGDAVLGLYRELDGWRGFQCFQCLEHASRTVVVLAVGGPLAQLTDGALGRLVGLPDRQLTLVAGSPDFLTAYSEATAKPVATQMDKHIRMEDMEINVIASPCSSFRHPRNTVSVTHVPTGKTKACSEGMSDHANRAKALEAVIGQLLVDGWINIVEERP